MKIHRAENLSVVLTKAIEFVFLASVLIGTTLLPSEAVPIEQEKPYWFPYHCAIEVPSGTTIFNDHVYRTPDGKMHAFARGTCPGQIVDRAPNIDGYVAWQDSSNANGYTYIDGQWTVPAAPGCYSSSCPASGRSGPTNFLWNGICSLSCSTSNSDSRLLQPVLAWGCARNVTSGSPNYGNCVVGGNYWWASAILDVPATHSYYYSGTIGPNVNDAIEGKVAWSSSLSQCTGTSSTGYTITAKDLTLSYTTSLVYCDNTSTYNYIYGAVLESKECDTTPNPDNCSYGLSACNELPGNANSVSVVFSSTVSTPDVTSGNWAGHHPTTSPNCNANSGTPSGGPPSAWSFTLSWKGTTP